MKTYSQKDLDRFWDKVLKTNNPDECWEWSASRNEKGYGHIWWTTLQRSHCVQQSHRVAWMITFGDIPDGMLVLHKCDNRSCCNPTHLFLGTNQDNSDDKLSKDRGKWFSGESNKNHRLTDVQVAEIRRRYKPGRHRSMYLLAKEFGVSRGYIWKIISGTNRVTGVDNESD